MTLESIGMKHLMLAPNGSPIICSTP